MSHRPSPTVTGSSPADPNTLSGRLSPLRRIIVSTVGRAARSVCTVRHPERLAQLPDPLIFVLNHSNYMESLLVPVTLIYHRQGRLIHFMVDWMFRHLPLIGTLLRLGETVPVYTKPARWRLFEGYRRRQRTFSPVDECLALLAAGRSVGIYPEGTRNPDPLQLRRARPGLAHLILTSTAPVVPVGIHFPTRNRRGLIPALGRFTITIGEALSFEAERRAYRHPGRNTSMGPETPHRDSQLSRQVLSDVMQALSPLCGKTYPFAHPDVRGNRSGKSPAGYNHMEGRNIMSMTRVTATKVTGSELRAEALQVIQQVFVQEKGWISAPETQIDEDIGEQEHISWFLVRANGKPAGVIRLYYDPPIQIPAEYEPEFEADINLDAVARMYRFVEIGRFMIIPAYRRNIRVVMSLMKVAVKEVVQRGYTHFITDVYESDPHCPYKFHVQVLGFQRIGTHRFGELNCNSLRIILVLDIARAYRRMKQKRNRIFREFTEGISEELEALPLPIPILPEAGNQRSI
ncbi:MAG: 1-acyl-sn-glycerol-3-phosphate acyltransferase [Acidobacteria bacterium]|nr:1-acyl-sn-glycerol-3-phosphate acyltransferase [Acidobacteriota bacterium]